MVQARDKEINEAAEVSDSPAIITRMPTFKALASIVRYLVPRR